MTDTSAPAEVVPVWAVPADPVGDLAIRLAARAMAREDEDGEWTWRDIAKAALEKPLAADALDAGSIAAILLSTVNAPEQEIYRVARQIAALSSGKTVGAGEGGGDG